jgi:hypothetical protein
MESADRGPRRFVVVLFLFLWKQLADTFLHFARRFIRESHGENIRGVDSPADHVSDPKRNDARFARSRPRQDQNRAPNGFNCLPLLGV